MTGDQRHTTVRSASVPSDRASRQRQRDHNLALALRIAARRGVPRDRAEAAAYRLGRTLRCQEGRHAGDARGGCTNYAGECICDCHDPKD